MNNSCTNSSKNNINTSNALNFNIYFGDIHNHTSYSDGSGTAEEAFKYANSSSEGDFLIITDHSFSVSPENWNSTKEAAKKYTNSNFISIAAFECTICGCDMNVYNVDDILVPEGTWNKTPEALEKFYTYLETNYPNAITSFNHPDTYWSTIKEFDDFNFYTPFRGDMITSLEVRNDTSFFYERSFIKALDKGWFVGPTAVSDTHGYDWLTRLESRTAILATSLSKESIFDALKNRRFYGSEDKNLRIFFTINDNIMGSKISCNSDLKFSIQVEDPDTSKVEDKISLVEVFSNNGTVVASKRFNSHNINWDFSLKCTSPAYYYVKVTNLGCKRAWTSPIWVNF